MPDLPQEEVEKQEAADEEVIVEAVSETPAAEGAPVPAADATEDSTPAPVPAAKKKFMVSRQYGGDGGEAFDHRTVSRSTGTQQPLCFLT